MALSCENRIKILTNDFHTLIKYSYAELFKMDQDFGQSGWISLGDKDNSTKIVAKNDQLNLVIKTFAPVTDDYASRMHQALLEIANIKILPIPALLPIEFCDRTFIYQLGTPRGTLHLDQDRFGDHRFLETNHLINPITDKYHISLAGQFDIIEIGKNLFITDIFEDTSLYTIPSSRQ